MARTCLLKNLKACLLENWTTLYFRVPMPSKSWLVIWGFSEIVQCLNWWKGALYALFTLISSSSSLSSLFSFWFWISFSFFSILLRFVDLLSTFFCASSKKISYFLQCDLTLLASVSFRFLSISISSSSFSSSSYNVLSLSPYYSTEIKTLKLLTFNCSSISPNSSANILFSPKLASVFFLSIWALL